ncbi:hypothetical protein PMAYCL1PPCAC_32590 [Pristionchus mayeri]|uniref:EF-hand domain-containing protein n=1 Tax=Pristionchus mayeri TaxID=1317129 RepID=A0AAN5DHL7_9BILA|nr:hypothetical protein PMAYCL1PPCAC_32590 [Pristionchus mayeri]
MISPLRGEISMDQVIALAKSNEQPNFLIDFVQFLIRNPLITEKQFSLAFIRIVLAPHDQHREPRVLPYASLADYRIRGVSASALAALVDVLIGAVNQKLRQMDVEVRRLVRDVDGKYMIALVTTMMYTEELTEKGSSLSELELALIFEWVHAMYDVDGRGHISIADVFATAETLRLTPERTLEILAFLCKHKYFDQTDTGFVIAYRGMMELDPVVTSKFHLKMCPRCDRLVVMTRARRMGDEVAHAGCTNEPSTDRKSSMIHYHLRIYGCENIVQKERRRLRGRRHRAKRARMTNVFEVTTDDEEDILNESWSDDEEAHYEPSEIERLCMDEIGVKY